MRCRHVSWLPDFDYPNFPYRGVNGNGPGENLPARCISTLVFSAFSHFWPLWRKVSVSRRCRKGPNATLWVALGGPSDFAKSFGDSGCRPPDELTLGCVRTPSATAVETELLHTA